MVKQAWRKAAATAALLMVATGIGAAPATAATAGGNKDCAAGFTTLKYDGMPYEGQVITDGVLTVTVIDVDYKADGSGEVYGFAVTQSGASLIYVIVKGGPDSIRHANGQLSDLDTRLSPGGRHYAISNVKFCYKA